MYYYIKMKSPTSSKLKLYRRNSKVVVFGKDNLAKTAKKELEEKGMLSVKIVSSSASPAERKCAIFGRAYEKSGW